MGKFMKTRFTSARKEARATKMRKAVERDPAWSSWWATQATSMET
jgi:hypothetical protein